MRTVSYTPTPKQAQFHRALDRYDTVGFISGVNAGKTTAGMCEAIRQASTRVCDGMIVTPTNEMFVKVVQPILRKWLPREWIADSNKVDKWIRLKNGSTIWYASGHDPQSLEGTTLSWAWLDEAKNYDTDEVYNIMSARLGRNADGGKMWITTTPIGIFHWLYEVFVNSALPHTTYIKASTQDNIYAPPSYYERLKSMYTGVYAKQQLEGDFVSFEGLVYDTFSLTENVAPVERNPNNPLFIGVDNGWADGGGEGTIGYHPRVILFIEQQSNGAFHVIDEYVATHELAEVSLDRVFKMYPDISGTYIDSSASELIRRIADRGISYAKSTHRVVDGIQVVRRYVMDGNGVRMLLINPRCKSLIKEFQMYRYSPNASKVEAGEMIPYKQDDHCLDALRYCLYKRGKYG